MEETSCVHKFTWQVPPLVHICPSLKLTVFRPKRTFLSEGPGIGKAQTCVLYVKGSAEVSALLIFRVSVVRFLSKDVSHWTI